MRRGKRSSEAQLQAAPARHDQDRARPLGQFADGTRHLLGGEQLSRKGAGGVAVVELVLQHRRPDAVRADGRELDAVDSLAPQVEERAEGEGHRRVLAGRVVDLARGGDDPGQRDHVDHVAAACGDHRLQGGDRPVHRAQRVDLSIRRRVSSSCVQAGPVTSTPALFTQRSSEPRCGFGGQRPAGCLVAHVERATAPRCRSRLPSARPHRRRRRLRGTR